MLREIVNIDEELCNGCGDCVPNCHEGALQNIDGKARLISDLMCDGLGACLGHCPLGAITMEEREAEAYDEVKVMKDMVAKGKNTIIAHLSHLKDHSQTDFLKQGVKYLVEIQDSLEFNLDEVLNAVHNGNGQEKSTHANHQGHHHHNNHEHHTKKKNNVMEESQGMACGCPGSAEQSFNQTSQQTSTNDGPIPSALSHWPIQMHLINPRSPHFTNSDFVLAADCTAFSIGRFHPDFLNGKTLAIACPKLDDGSDVYIQKIQSLIDDSQINTLTVMVMEVPCCGGLSQMVQMAASQASRKVPIKQIVISVQGEVLAEEWV
jgi:NAD-dependent dihydropyrimidine dehydrogenase PreA subunit